MRRRTTTSRTLSRLLLRPYALAHRPAELPVAVACAALLFLVFFADILTPIQVAVSALGLIPLLAAMWLLSDRVASALAAVAVGQLVITGVVGRLSLATVASEATAYVLLAIVCRLYAASLADLLARKSRAIRKAEQQSPPVPMTLTFAARPASTKGMESLTTREQQVTRLAAQGYTAREIGSELHIGRRTVETHLVNAYDKLGVRSKRELIRSMATSRPS
jgi:DNA-binding CsgD family transcriptional regulator